MSSVLASQQLPPYGETVQCHSDGITGTVIDPADLYFLYREKNISSGTEWCWMDREGFAIGSEFVTHWEKMTGVSL